MIVHSNVNDILPLAGCVAVDESIKELNPPLMNGF